MTREMISRCGGFCGSRSWRFWFQGGFCLAKLLFWDWFGQVCAPPVQKLADVGRWIGRRAPRRWMKKGNAKKMEIPIMASTSANFCTKGMYVCHFIYRRLPIFAGGLTGGGTLQHYVASKSWETLDWRHQAYAEIWIYTKNIYIYMYIDCSL